MTLKVYNDIGQEVATLVDNEEAAGTHVATWNVPQGGTASVTHFYRLRVGGKVVSTMKANLVK